MPLIEVKLFDFRMDEETSNRSAEGRALRLAIWTLRHTGIVEGHSPKDWGVGGVPWPAEKTPD